MTENPLIALRGCGQSVWYDNIERGLLLSGGLRRLVSEDGVVGVTSNPTIFQKAIGAGAEYDATIEELVSKGLGTAEILDALVFEDIGMAADLLHPTYESTETVDGWVSIEVPASMAYQSEATVREVERLRKAVGRPNVLVKIPATADGVQAIEESISRGWSINVTLIFSLERYREVMEAYLSGLEKLVALRQSGEELPPPETVRSVASFFVSRVDTKVDKRLEELARTAGADGERERLLAMRSKAAVANAVMAYQEFLKTFSGQRWEALEQAGAKVQRPLWASTSTKNPEYSDVLYVEGLIGPNTVNTMPQNTLDAYRDHGRPRCGAIVAEAEEARRLLDDLAGAGVDMDQVTAELESEGVKAFGDSYDDLYATTEEKRQRLAAHARD
jgi:transaldolase